MFKLKTTLIALALVLPLQSQANFIKYKNYYIPIAEKVQVQGSCEAMEIPNTAPAAVDSGKARVFVTTDVNALVGDPDDTQSLAHILTFSNEIELEGFSTSSPSASDNFNDVITDGRDIILNAIDQYELDLPKLSLAHDPRDPDEEILVNPADFPDPAFLKNNVYRGSSLIGNATGGNDITGGGWFRNDGSISEGAQAIITSVRCAYQNGDTRPLYVLTWGTSSEVVRALEKAPDILKHLRVVSYSHYNNEDNERGNFAPVNDYLKRVAKDKDLWWIDYPAGSSTLPLTSCGQGDLNGYASTITSNGYLGANTIKYNNPNGTPNTDSCNDSYFKLGDTITTMFVLFTNSSIRSYPFNAHWGGYQNVPSIGINYWALPDATYNQRYKTYKIWAERAEYL